MEFRNFNLSEINKYHDITNLGDTSGICFLSLHSLTSKTIYFFSPCYIGDKILPFLKAMLSSHHPHTVQVPFTAAETGLIR